MERVGRPPQNVQEHEGRFASINGIWKDITYAEERSAADRRHEEAISCWEGVGTDVSGLLEVVGKSQEDKKRDGLLDWLSTLDPSEAYNAARQKHTKGTSDWLIKDSEAFNAWEKSESSLLWLNGKRMYECRYSWLSTLRLTTRSWLW